MAINLQPGRAIFLTSCTAACALVLLLGIRKNETAARDRLSMPAGAIAKSQIYEGVVTCSRCGARHTLQGRSAAECTRICVRDGADLSLVDGDKSYVLDVEPYSLGKVIGQRARISGIAEGNKIRVVSVLREDNSETP